MPSFGAPYGSRTPAARAVAQAFGVVHPHVMTKAQVATLLAQARFRHRGKVIPISRYKAVFKDVVDAGIVADTEYGGQFAAAADWAPWLTLQARRDGRLESIEDAFDDHVHRYWYKMEPGERVMRLRCHTVAGRFSRIHTELGDIAPDEWCWLTKPGAAVLIGQLPAGYIDDAVAACLMEIVRTAEAPEAILDVLEKSGADRARHAGDIAFIRILQGEHDEALAVFADLPGDQRESKPARTGLAATRALLATLRGDDDEAAKYIGEAIASDKQGTRKRNIFPRCAAFTLSLLSLVRNHTPANAAKVEHLLRIGPKLGADASLLRAVSLAVRVRKVGAPSWNPDGESLSFERLAEGWAACWSDFFIGNDGAVRMYALSDFGAKASVNGYRWLAAECLQVVGRWWTDRTGRPETELAKRINVTLNGEPAALTEVAATVHAGLGTTTLSSLLAPISVWEHALQGIEQVAYEAGRKKSGRGKTAATRRKRLAWVLTVDENGGLAATPREQHTLKSGRWSKGRPVALKRLHAQAGTMDFLIGQDRAAAAEIVHNTYRWSNLPAHYLPTAGICALAGHPYLFNEHGDPLEMVHRDPELLLDENDDVLHARVEPHCDNATTDDYHVSVASPVRIEVTRFTPGHKKLCEAIPPDGLALPPEARQRLVDAVSALSGEIRVQGAIAVGAQAATRTEADPRPWVRLEPSGPGLLVALLVEPVPGSGTRFQPGIGGTTAFASIEGKTVQAPRDLEAETRAARDLVRACPMLSGVGPDWSLALPDPADCLELVDQLDSGNTRCLWPKGEPFRVVSRADAGSLQLSVRTAADWFSASGTLHLDEDRALDLRRLFELIDQSPSSRFVSLGEGAFVSLTASFQRQLADLRSVSAASGKSRIRVHGMAALALQDFFGNTSLEADEGWRTRLRRFREAREVQPRTPGTLQAELRPYQEEGFRWLARLSHWGAGACLADDMGLGKTVQTLAVLLHRGGDGPALVVAPTSVVANWLDECRRFAPSLNVRAYTGPAASRAQRLEGLAPLDVVVTTYGLLHNDADALGAVEWSTAVLDEAQAIKNPATKRARAARGISARFRVVTTGTPVQNNVVDLYSLFSFLNPGMLGSLKRFRENFALPIERDGDPAARMRLRRLIAPFVLRRVKADVLDDLPPRTEVTLHVEMSPEEAALYEALRQRAMEDLEALADADSGAGGQRLQVLAHLTRLRLACCNPRLVQPKGPPSSKLATFADTLDELRQGRHKVLVFSQFVRHLKLIEEHLAASEVPYQYLDGSTPAKVRAERIAAFQAGEGDAFLISLKAGGTGLNLTAADYVIHMDPWWNPAAEDQASDRAHRIGQTRPVTIYRLVAKGTIEEQIVELHRHKRELANRLLEGADAPSRLGTEELLGLLRGAG